MTKWFAFCILHLLFSEGNLSDIAENKRFSRFLTTLSIDFGPLSSFYWGSTYVVCVSSWDLWNQLKTYEKFRSSALSFPTFYALKNNSYFKISIKNQIDEHITDKSIGDENLSWKIALNSIFQVNLDDGTLIESASLIDKIIESHDECLQNGPQSNGKTLKQSVSELLKLFRYKAKNDEHFVAQCFLCSAVKKCILVVLSNNIPESFAKDDKTYSSMLNSYVLETIRKAVPFDLLCYNFTKEIDVNGHPIPAEYPIIVNVHDLFNDAKTFGIPENFDAFRFGPTRSKKLNTIAETIETLPFFDELFALIVGTTKNFALKVSL